MNMKILHRDFNNIRIEEITLKDAFSFHEIMSLLNLYYDITIKKKMKL